MKQTVKKKYYIVKKGKQPGVYYNWPDCQKQVQGFAGAIFKGFASKEEAEAWYGKPIEAAPKALKQTPKAKPMESKDIHLLEIQYPSHCSAPDGRRFSWSDTATARLPEKLTIFTDGSCLVNPDGPGGFAAVFLTEDGGRELFHVTGGEPCSTNNRMELRAAYEALKLLQYGVPRHIVFHTDSKYLQRAFMNHWINNWKRNGWKTSQGTPVVNQDLWKGLLPLMEKHTIQFEWVKGHVGTKYNELCDQLAKKEAMKYK